ncbi:MAG: repeat-associated core domain protein, partial [Firmicutes bacterium]|nr:repeat-associated core domain protein [Bacillota bacterium]
TGANLRVYFKDASGNYIYNGGNIVKYESKAVSGSTDWTRLSNYFTAPANTATIQIDLLFTGAGTVYFDGAELVYGRVLDNYYSNENAGFEWGNLDNWTMSDLSP